MATPCPDAAALYEAALAHLARYAASEAGLARVLARRLDRWARQAAAEDEADSEAIAARARAARATIPGIVARLRAGGALDDARYAASRAVRLARGGKSRNASLAHLAAKGIASGAAREAVGADPERELAAACAFLRRRRLGPFGAAEPLKSRAALARAGFPRSIADAALRLTETEASALIASLA